MQQAISMAIREHKTDTGRMKFSSPLLGEAFVGA
jgi:hypothetical protein